MFSHTRAHVRVPPGTRTHYEIRQYLSHLLAVRMEFINAEETFTLMEELNLFEYLDWRVVLKGYLTADSIKFQLWLRKRVKFVITRGLLNENSSKTRSVRLLLISLGEIADLEAPDDVVFGMEVPEDVIIPDFQLLQSFITNSTYVQQEAVLTTREIGALSAFLDITCENYIQHLTAWSRFLPHSVIERALSVCEPEQCVVWMRTTLETIVENLPISRYLVDNIAVPLFRLPFFNSRGQQSFDLPDRHFRVCITTAAEVMKFDVYTHREVLVGVKGPNGNIVSIQLPSLPLEYPVDPNHSLYCPKLINRLLPDRFTNRNCAYLVPHRAPPAAPTMGVEPEFSESTDTSQVMQHADKRSRST